MKQPAQFVEDHLLGPNYTGYPAAVTAWLVNPTSANLYSAMVDKTGTNLLVFNTDPVLVTPSLSGETYSTSATVTAGSDAQGQGALTADLNVITAIPGAGSEPFGVTLPTATVGRRVVVMNRTTSRMKLYPASGAQIDALGTNTSIRLAPLTTMVLNASSTTQWYSDWPNFYVNSAANQNWISNGYFTQLNIGTVSSNTAWGYSALADVRSGSNCAVGFLALTSALTGNDNLAFGARAGQNCTGGNNNAFFGSSSGFSVTNATRNTFFGRESGVVNTLGGQNCFIGYKAGVSYNYTAGITATDNTLIGAWSGKTLTTGINNTFIGSGIESATNSPGITTGSYNTIVGAAVVGLATGLANHIVLSDGQGNMRLFANGSGNVGIGMGLTTGSPVISARLHVISTSAPQYRLGYDINNYLDISVSSAGAVTFNPTGASAGLMFGSSSSKLIGFYGVGPVAQSAAYTVSNYTTDRTIDKSTATVGEVTDVLLTLIADLKLTGIIG